MIAVLLLLLAAAATPTLEEVTRLPPAAAGDLALADYPHARIVEVRPGPGGLVPPGVAELTMVERPTPLSGEGCFRQYWNVSFQRNPEGPPAPQRLVGAQPYTEVATRSGEGCPNTGYVRTNSGVSAVVAVAELSRLHDWQVGSKMPEYRCVDRTYSDFCAAPEKTRLEVAQLRPWMMSRDLLYIEIWLGTPGSVVTALRYVPGDHVSSVTVTRSIPAPF